MHIIIFMAFLAAVHAMPSYIAVPADQIAFVDLSALRARRVPRQILTPPVPQLPEALYEDNYQPIPLPNYQHGTVALAPPPAPESRERIQVQPRDGDTSSTKADGVAHYAGNPSDFGPYVDFGAHTGDNGAFGWYADYPVNN